MNFEELIKSIKHNGVLPPIEIDEEEEPDSTFDFEGRKLYPLEGDEFRTIPLKRDISPHYIAAFLDGVQRMTLWRYVQMGSSFIPVHNAQVSAGVIFRDEDGNLYPSEEFVLSRYLLILPFLEELELSSSLEGVISDSSEKIFRLPKVNKELVICNLLESLPTTSEEPLKARDLLNEYELRYRAKLRVNHMRQILEFLCLAKFKKKHPNKWLVIDGPLPFLIPQRKPMYEGIIAYLSARDLKEAERKLLYRVIGIVKTHKLNPGDYEVLSSLNGKNRTTICTLQSNSDESYTDKHICWYTRLGKTKGLMGLVRIDLHAGTLDLKKAADFKGLNRKERMKLITLVDSITRGLMDDVRPMRKPRSAKNRELVTLYPIRVLERYLRSKLLSYRQLKHFYKLFSY